MARDLEHGGVDFLGGVVPERLRLLELRLSRLPDPFCVGELMLRRFHLPPRHLPRLLRVALLRRRDPQLLLQLIAGRAAPPRRLGFVAGDLGRAD